MKLMDLLRVNEPATMNESGNVETLPASEEPEITVVSNRQRCLLYQVMIRQIIPASDDNGNIPPGYESCHTPEP